MDFSQFKVPISLLTFSLDIFCLLTWHMVCGTWFLAGSPDFFVVLAWPKIEHKHKDYNGLSYSLDFFFFFFIIIKWRTLLSSSLDLNTSISTVVLNYNNTPIHDSKTINDQNLTFLRENIVVNQIAREIRLLVLCVYCVNYRHNNCPRSQGPFFLVCAKQVKD